MKLPTVRAGCGLLILGLAACGANDPQPGPHGASATVTAATPCETFGDKQAAAAAGAAVGEPTFKRWDDLPMCMWPIPSNEAAGIMAYDIPATEWGANVLPFLRQSLNGIADADRLEAAKKAIRLIEANDPTCRAFMLQVESFPGAEKGANLLVKRGPDATRPNYVDVQTCVDGRFRGAMYVNRDSIADPEAVADRVRSAAKEAFGLL